MNKKSDSLFKIKPIILNVSEVHLSIQLRIAVSYYQGTITRADRTSNRGFFKIS